MDKAATNAILNRRIATNFKEENDISNRTFGDSFSCIKKAAAKLLRIWKRPNNSFIVKKKPRSGIFSNP